MTQASASPQAVGYCGNDFCGGQKSSIDVTCHDLGKSAGKEIMYQRPNGTCYCICSCIGDGTQVTLADGNSVNIERVEQGKTWIRAAGRDLRFTEYLVSQVSFAPKSKTLNTIRIQYTTRDGNKHDLICTQSHPFLLYGSKQLCAAANLTPDDRLLDSQGNPVAIDRLDWGEYNGSFWEIATTMAPPDQDLNGHLILTNGVVSGDFAIETFVNYPIGDAAVPFEIRREAAVVGSEAWRQEHGDHVAPLNGPVGINGGVFTPHHLSRVDVPSHAADFLPWWQADFLRLVAPKRPYNDPYALEMCEWLLDRVYRPLYPDVTFLFDWYSDEVNSHSWVTDGKKYVYLPGGLSRIDGFDYDGVALALAHEVGHLYGKPDGSESGVTCEGEADFYGAAVVMRKLWFGEQYFESTQKAIDQVKTLYEYMGRPAPDGARFDSRAVRLDKAGRVYPSNQCRIDTWEAAMQGPTKPACADCNLAA
ncbi:hypothetical protein [Burkholderia stabilis]|uniref:hypothetical protein n=1 Tax=Burkholderia stabilis TaxID=95485 RepID=UPI00114689C6|nr:hypothetical protein [Burkholderia stabilis]